MFAPARQPDFERVPVPKKEVFMAFLDVVEVGGEDVSQEQVLRTHHRYYWAASFCADKDILEVGCGSGFSLSYLKSMARSLEAGDYSAAVLDLCRSKYGEIV